MLLRESRQQLSLLPHHSVISRAQSHSRNQAPASF